MLDATSSEAPSAEGVPPDTVVAGSTICETAPDGETQHRSNVVGLDGRVFTPAQGPQVSATLVGELERLLDAAKAGDIIGMAGSFIHADRLVSYSFAGAVGGFSIIGGLECLKERLVRNALTTD